ncbi:ABC transporter [Candidimonas sp. SYP-B2681]|uniref:ABC-type transport auxiliary lipoprotein family protein n=1 Tax=Candidimonas sp. SYP-B2681 TaxID=2497686 RepID=UPI000F86AC7D|nr:ABC-type transport auxiliary lipoprotein family protein [Candidimonas sp. SYP-B2681]RTZ42575.1 ABC transporter [Candidimonas sp. SYP-B2681]
MIRPLSARTTIYRCLLIAALAVISACSILPKPETLTVYQLQAPSIERKTQSHPLAWSLRIATPYSSQVIDSMRVLVLPEANRVSAYSGARWGDPAPVLLRNYLAAAFRASGALASVSTDVSNGQADYELGGDLIAFQVEYVNDAPVVRIRLDATLTRDVNNRIISARSFEVRQAVDGTEVPKVIAAFEIAIDQLSVQLMQWVSQQGAGSATTKK